MKNYKNAGDEPSWGDNVLTQEELGSAFNWYSARLTKKDIYEIITENGNFTKEEIQ